MENKKDIYEKLGVKKIINAAGTYTIIGGSRMSQKTLQDLSEAASSHVTIRELQEKVHERLAQMTKNEAAYVCNGAASGLYLSIAACISLKNAKAFNYLSKKEIFQSEVIVFSSHRNPYDWAMRQLGVKVVQIGYPNMILPPTSDDLKNAITEKTVAIYYVASNDGGWIPTGALQLEEVVKAGKLHNIPIVVDAAAQLPPVENFWKYTKKGATVTLFSGGKDLRGPQSSGLIVGQKRLVEVINSIGFPNYGIGRMLKVGREELVGLFSAVEQFINMDHEARKLWCENQIKQLREAFSNSDLFKVDRTYPNEAGQPIPRAFVNILDNSRISSEGLQQLLMEGEYGIFTMSEQKNGVYINPMTLQEGEITVIINRLKEIENIY